MWPGVIHINLDRGAVDTSRHTTTTPVHPQASSQLTQYTNHHFGTAFPSRCGSFWNRKPKEKKSLPSESFARLKIYFLHLIFRTHLITNGFACHPHKMYAPRRNAGVCPPYRPPSLFLPPASTNPGRVCRERGASLANSTELIGCKVLWVEGSLGAEVNMCVFACVFPQSCVHGGWPELGPI